VAINQILGVEAFANGGAAPVESESSRSPRYRYSYGASVERLMNFLTALDRNMDIVIRRRPERGRAGVS
jgi:hypothetical protein